MQRVLTALVAFLCAVPLAAQDDRPFEAKKPLSGFDVEGLFRQEWTRNFFDPLVEDAHRQRGRLLPRVTAGGNHFQVGFGGDFNYSSDENTDPLPTLLRDNYKSRDARLDLAFIHLQPLSWLKIDGGRFVMPVALTEMIWDKDLRPQGGAATIETAPTGDIEKLTGTFLLAQGSHVFEDDDTRMMIVSGSARMKAGLDSHIEATVSLVQWEKLSALEPMIRRQNSRDETGLVRDDYRVVDVVGRLQLAGAIPTQLIANIAWNTKIDEKNRGIWGSLVLGSLVLSRARAEYTYARVDKDLTVAAYNTDDFFWGTGWEGHRLELGTRISDRLTAHAIGQLQRFKDSPNEAERDHFVQRIRLELRLKS